MLWVPTTDGTSAIVPFGTGEDAGCYEVFQADRIPDRYMIPHDDWLAPADKWLWAVSQKNGRDGYDVDAWGWASSKEEAMQKADEYEQKVKRALQKFIERN